MSGRRGVVNYNTVQEPAQPGAEFDAKQIKAEFARRLEAFRVRRGWNQSELARRATDQLPKPAPGQKRHHKIGRDLISHYSRGLMLPGNVVLEALAKALGVEKNQLMPPMMVPHVAVGEAPPFAMKALADGRAELNVNRVVRMETAMKIMAMLAEEDKIP